MNPLPHLLNHLNCQAGLKASERAHPYTLHAHTTLDNAAALLIVTPAVAAWGHGSGMRGCCSRCSWRVQQRWCEVRGRQRAVCLWADGQWREAAASRASLPSLACEGPSTVLQEPYTFSPPPGSCSACMMFAQTSSHPRDGSLSDVPHALCVVSRRGLSSGDALCFATRPSQL